MSLAERTAPILFIITALFLGACSNSQTSNNAGADNSSMQTATNASEAPYDLQFIDTMTAHHQIAIDMANMCDGRAQHPELINLAKNIATTQTDEIAKMKQWRDQWFDAAPPATNMNMSGMKDAMSEMDMAKLQSLTGNAFDLEFIRQMIPHHVGAILMANEAFQKSERNETKLLAGDIIKAQSAEVGKMKEWQKQWSK